MKTTTGVALVWMAGSLACHAADEPQAVADPKAPVTAVTLDRKPGGDRSPIPQDEKVVITVTREKLASGKYVEKLVAKPRFAIIRKHQPLRWTVQDLPAGYSVEIDFEVYDGHKGPFERAKNPYRGRFVLNEKTPDVEAPPSDAAGYFEYHLVLRDANGDDVFALDPGVLVKNDF